MGFEGRISEVGAADQPDRTKVPPALPEIVEPTLGTLIEAEHTKKQERPRRRHRC
jgi:hypothetical protein